MRIKNRTRPGPAKRDVPTIHDVARVAGVSAATVSRAFAKPRAVAPTTRARVAEAARTLGYKPSGSIRSGDNMVLALVPHLNGSFFTPFLDAASDLLSESGYCMTIGDISGSGKKEQHYARALRDGRFAGAILFTGSIPRDRSDDARLSIDIPIVLACNEISGLSDLPVFDVNDRKAATKMVAYLTGLGHSRIAHIRGPVANIEARERFEGYSEAMQAAGLQIDPDLVWEGDFFLGSGIAAAGRYLASHNRPTAVFAGNDQMAMGFVTEVKAAGFSVPGDVSVAAFDDIEFSEIFDPPLTTMRQPREEIGRLAALELLRRMNGDGPGETPRKARMECELVIRASTRALRLTIEERFRQSETNRARKRQSLRSWIAAST